MDVRLKEAAECVPPLVTKVESGPQTSYYGPPGILLQQGHGEHVPGSLWPLRSPLLKGNTKSTFQQDLSQHCPIHWENGSSEALDSSTLLSKVFTLASASRCCSHNPSACPHRSFPQLSTLTKVGQCNQPLEGHMIDGKTKHKSLGGNSEMQPKQMLPK